MLGPLMPGSLRFFCDEQLGKLSRWLRIIGQDTAYERAIADADLLARAAAEARIVLTRDHHLPKLARKNSAPDRAPQVIVLAENYPALQLREVVELFRDRMQISIFSRCPVCNAETVKVAKEEVAAQLPPFVAASQQEFTRCPGCGRVYWQATHRARVDLVLRDLLEEGKEGER